MNATVKVAFACRRRLHLFQKLKPKKSQKEEKMNNTMKITLVIGGAAVLGTVTFFAAPVIAASLGTAGLLGTTATTGTAISGLSGAALTNASLAALGGGALSAGGAGIAGGTVVVA